MKSSIDEIRARFDGDVERFSNLETGQSATLDSLLCLELVATAAARCTPQARRLLDVGCGAGNYALKLIEQLPDLAVTLVDLSLPMLERAEARVRAAGTREVQAIQSDIRQVHLPVAQFDIIVAASVLHHLRTDGEWEKVFQSFYQALSPGGSLWVFDLIDSSIPAVQEMMNERYAKYLVDLRGEAYRDEVFAYIEKEDTPRPLVFQLELLRKIGFRSVDILHKNTCFAAFGAVK